MCVYVEGGLVCVNARTQHSKAIIRKGEHLGRYTAPGSSRHMFAKTGTTSQVVIINHHQEKLSRR